MPLSAFKGKFLGNYQWNQAVLVCAFIGLMGCAEVSPPVSQETQSRSTTFSIPQQIKDLAGPWEYKDDAGKGTINLNELGKGEYDWEEGRFETVSLKEGQWIGIWVQEGNDREGGFELKFSKDSPVAQGKWWYTRIENNHEPLQSGGSFWMARRSAISPAK